MKTFAKITAVCGIIALFATTSVFAAPTASTMSTTKTKTMGAKKGTHVKGYTKTLKSGKTVKVKGYTRKPASTMTSPKKVHVKGYTKTSKTGKVTHVKGYTRKAGKTAAQKA